MDMRGYLLSKTERELIQAFLDGEKISPLACRARTKWINSKAQIAKDEELLRCLEAKRK